MTKRLVFVLLMVFIASFSLGGAPASASNRGDLGTITPTSGDLQKSFPAINGQFSASGQPPPATPFAAVKYHQCRDSAYCDTIGFKVSVDPNEYKEIYRVVVTLDWPGTAASNDVDLWVWVNDTAALAPASGGPICSSTTRTNKPEKCGMGEPGPGQFWITVVNFRGLNAGYTLNVSWELTDLGPEYTRPNRDIREEDEGSFSFTGKGSSPTSGAQPPAEESAPTVKVPGPDGQLVEQELPVLVQGRERRGEDSGMGALVWVIIALLVVGLATFGVLFIRRRRAEPV